jgi:hypothetical protein
MAAHLMSGHVFFRCLADYIVGYNNFIFFKLFQCHTYYSVFIDFCGKTTSWTGGYAAAWLQY